MALLIGGLLGLPAIVSAGPAIAGPDQYADAVDTSNTIGVSDAGEAVGAPDGQAATVANFPGNALVLDLGAGEEGTGDLTITYSTLAAGLVVEVEFLDANGNVIETVPTTLVQTPTGPTTVTVPYGSAPAPYRFVRLPSVAGAYTVDAIEAASFRPDSDDDGLPDTWELQYGLNPLDPNGANGANGDPDGDGLPNIDELAVGTNPRVADSDGDGLPDGWEVQYGLNPLDPNGADGASGDPDGDGLSNEQEFALGTNPTARDPDSDGDGLPNAYETRYGLNPNDASGRNGANGDADGDGLTNLQELQAGSNPSAADTDGDGLPDGWELRYGLDPRDPTGRNGANGDPDGDGRNNAQEYAAGTNPTAAGARVFLPVVRR